MKWLEILSDFSKWISSEYIKDYRESSARLFELQQKNNSQINQIILTVSVACLTAIAAMSQKIFKSCGYLAFSTIIAFTVVILLSVINLYLSLLALQHAQSQLLNNFSKFKSVTSGMSNLPYVKRIKILNQCVLALFCIGVVLFLVLLGIYIFGVVR